MERLSADYEGVALSLVDALTTLAVMGNASEFAWAVRWLSANVRLGARMPCASGQLIASPSRQPHMHAQAMPLLITWFAKPLELVHPPLTGSAHSASATAAHPCTRF